MNIAENHEKVANFELAERQKLYKMIAGFWVLLVLFDIVLIELSLFYSIPTILISHAVALYLSWIPIQHELQGKWSNRWRLLGGTPMFVHLTDFDTHKWVQEHVDPDDFYKLYNGYFYVFKHEDHAVAVKLMRSL